MGAPESRYYPPPGPCRPPRRIRDANVRYHDLAAEHYDSKWGINYDAVGQAQVTGKLRKALGHEPAPLRARARDRRRHRLLHAQPAAGRAWSARRWPPTSRPACSSRLRALGRRAGAGGRDRRVRGGGAAVRGRLVRPRVRPRGAPPPARPDGRLPRVPARAAARAAWSPSAASRPTTATGSRAWPKRGAQRGGAAVAGAASGAGPRPSNGNGHGALERGGPARAGGGRARVHARAAVRSAPSGRLRATSA